MKYSSLESLRGVAALVVVLVHSRFLGESGVANFPQGAIAVDFFFILSGLVMAFAYTEKIQAGFNFKKFILLRFGRLYPLHLFMLLVWLAYFLVRVVLYHQKGVGRDPFLDSRFSLSSFASNVFLVQSLNLHNCLTWNTPSWSVSVEFFTYIVFFAFIFKTKLFFKPIYLMAVSLMSYGVLYAVAEPTTLLSTYQWGIFRCIGGFFFGAFLFFIARRVTWSPKTGWISLVEVCVVGIAFYLVTQSQRGKGYELASFITFGGMILLFATQEKGVISYLLTRKIMLLLGTLSYDIYMTHEIIWVVLGNVWEFVLKMPVEVVAAAGYEPVKVYRVQYFYTINLMCIVLIVAISYLTYTYIDSPWRIKFRTLAASESFSAHGKSRPSGEG